LPTLHLARDASSKYMLVRYSTAVNRMFSYGLTNFRRLKSIQPIPLKPITLLVGKNSSGKSSYLRSLPLLNQSISTDTSGAILWWGELVDFGSFKETIHYKSPEKEISFRFTLSDINLGDYSRFTTSYRQTQALRGQNAILRNVKIEVGISNLSREKGSDSTISYVSSYRIHSATEVFDVQLKFSPVGAIEQASLNSTDIADDLREKDSHISLNSLLPIISYKDSRGLFSFSEERFSENKIFQNTLEIIRNFYKKGTRISRLQEFSMLFLNSLSISSKRLKNIKESNIEDLRILADRIEKKATLEQAQILTQYSLINNLPVIMGSISQRLSQIISNVSYIGPARVRSERYYRQQDLSVSTISPDGNNFPIFLASLTRAQIDELSDIVYSLYGYKLRLKKEAGHISIFLEDEGFQINLIDTGYGLSQILPVIAQMWWAGREGRVIKGPHPRQGADRIVAIEQPELHLHPAHQASLADAFLLFSKPDQKAKRSQLQFLVETHSESLINRLGELVYEGKISKEDIQVVVFDTDAREKYTTSARISTFDDDGALQNWPVGFFSIR
jgi:predicted ATPase